jgi:2-iminoacetate synthase ThiH
MYGLRHNSAKRKLLSDLRNTRLVRPTLRKTIKHIAAYKLLKRKILAFLRKNLAFCYVPYLQTIFQSDNIATTSK